MNRTSRAAPYAVGLALAGVLFFASDRLSYTPRAGQLGPDVWPKLAVGLMAAVCAVEIIRALAGGRAAPALADRLENAGEDDRQGTHPQLLGAGIVLVVTYAILVPVLGFLLATLLFMAAFMYVGRYRHHLVIWTVSVAATLAIGLLFIRFAYVSLPRGAPPFDRFTDFVRIMLGG